MELTLMLVLMLGPTLAGILGKYKSNFSTVGSFFYSMNQSTTAADHD